MRQRFTVSTLMLMWLGCAATRSLVAAQPSTVEFSAEIIRHDAAGAVAGNVARIYVAGDKVRIEITESPAGYFMVDGTAQSSVFVRPAQQIVTPARQSTSLTQIFVPVDPAGPCPQWQAATQRAAGPTESPRSASWSCELPHSSSHPDPNLIEYEVTGPDHELSRRWVDAVLRFPVKVRSADGSTLELANIRLAPQQATLFEIPSGYRYLDPAALIERIRHSDVWVAPPPAN